MPRHLEHTRILLVEDNPGDQVLIEEYLKQEIDNPDITFAVSFAETSQILQQDQNLDVVLLDLALPDASGIELVEDVLSLSNNKPVIVLTGYGNKEFGLKTISYGVADYLLKDELNGTSLKKSITYAIERKRASITLENSEKKYKSIFEFSPTAMYIYNAENKKIIDVNEAALKQYGYTKTEMLQLTMYDLRSKTNHEKFEKTYQEVRSSENPNRKIEFEHIRKDGSTILVEVQNTNIEYEGIPAGIVIANDITERRKAEEQIKQSEERFRAVAETAKDAIITIDAHGEIVDWNNGAENIFGYTKAEMIGSPQSLYKIIPGDFKRHHIAGIQKIKAGHHTKLQGETLEMEGWHKSGKIIPISFSLAEWETKTGRFFTAIIRDITEAKKLIKMLKETNDYLENLFNYANAPIIVWDSDFYITRFNHAFEILTGYQETEVLGKHLEILFPADKKQASIAQIEKTLNGEYWDSVEIEIQHKDGFVKTALWNSANIFDTDGKTIIATIAQGQDITERKKAEEGLKLSLAEAQRFRKALDNVDSYIFMKDADYRYLYANKHTLTKFNVTAEELIGKKDEDFFPAETVQQILPNDKKAIEGENVGAEISEIAINGKEKTYYWESKTPIYEEDNPDKVWGMLGISTDITQLKKAENEIRRNQKLLVEAQNVAKMGYYVYHFSTGLWEGSPRIYEIMGLDYTPTKTIDEWINAIVPEQREQLTNYFKNCIGTLSPFDQEYKIRNKKTGKYVWLKGLGSFEFDENKEPIYMIGTVQDITVSKEEEIRLKLLESVITNATDGVAITEVDDFNPHNSKIIYINDAYKKMTGYTLEEVAGKNPRILQGPKTQRDQLDKMRIAIEKGEPCEIEVINYRKNKEAFWTSISISPIKDNNDKITHWIAIKRDINNRKEQEQEREQLINELTLHNRDLRQFSFITSHNMKAPLSNLQGLINLINDIKIEDEALKDIIDGFRVSTQQLNDTINDLIRILIIKDKTSIEQEKLDIKTIINDTCHKISELAKNYGQPPVYDIDVVHAPSITFNRSYFESILLQLLSNTIIYQSPERQLAVSITTEQTKEEVILHIKDNGIGLNTERYQDRLFGLYQRFHNNSNSKGLGLYLVKSQMEALGGSVEFISAENEGTELVLHFKKEKN